MEFGEWLCIRQKQYNRLVLEHTTPGYNKYSKETFDIHKKIVKELDKLPYVLGGSISKEE
jgi:hypothetical protein